MKQRRRTQKEVDQSNNWCVQAVEENEELMSALIALVDEATRAAASGRKGVLEFVTGHLGAQLSVNAATACKCGNCAVPMHARENLGVIQHQSNAELERRIRDNGWES